MVPKRSTVKKTTVSAWPPQGGAKPSHRRTDVGIMNSSFNTRREGTPAHCDASRISAGVLFRDSVAALSKFCNSHPDSSPIYPKALQFLFAILPRPSQMVPRCSQSVPKPSQNWAKIRSGVTLRASWETSGAQVEKKTRFWSSRGPFGAFFWSPGPCKIDTKSHIFVWCVFVIVFCRFLIDFRCFLSI